MGLFRDYPCCASCKHCVKDYSYNRKGEYLMTYKCLKGHTSYVLQEEFGVPVISLSYESINRDNCYAESCEGNYFEPYDSSMPAKRNPVLLP